MQRMSQLLANMQVLNLDSRMVKNLQWVCVVFLYRPLKIWSFGISIRKIYQTQNGLDSILMIALESSRSIGSVALLWRNAKRKCKFANKRVQANAHHSKWLRPGFTLHFVFRQSKATEPMWYVLSFKYIKSFTTFYTIKSPKLIFRWLHIPIHLPSVRRFWKQ